MATSAVPAIPASDPLPAAATITAALSLPLLSSTSETTTLQALLSSPSASSHATATLFIRHFYCSNCADYIRALSASPLSQTPSRILIIGCGAPSAIDQYRADTGCAFEIYTDPTGALYDALGMGKTLATGERGAYVQTGVLEGAVKGAMQALKGGVGKGGDFRRIGGEWVWRGGEVRWGRRMRGTRDHVEVEVLGRVLEMVEAGADGEMVGAGGVEQGVVG
ncbi:hypothetical protein EDC01DRAFT_715997 [Geopyxis carbonaria]|nr:hypothetical protein EDC01DRAFT_715997 [Geopyxis carbonaria]